MIDHGTSLTAAQRKALVQQRHAREQRRIRHDFLLALQDVYGTAESIEAEALMDQLDRRGLKVVVA